MMSEAPTNTDAQVLFPDGGANADPADPKTANLMPVEGDGSANPNPDPQEGGADTQPGNDSSTGPESVSGQESVAGESTPDALTADSYDIKLSEELQGNDALLTSAKTLFAEVGVDPAKAQQLVDFYTEALKTQAAETTAAWTAQQTAWKTEIEAMPEFKGPTRETSLQALGKLWDEFGTDEAKAALDAYGVGNNPALVRMFLKMASTISEASPAPQGRPAPMDRNGRPLGGRTVGETLFGDTPENNSIMVRTQ